MYILRHVNVHAQISNTRVKQTTLISNLGAEEHKVDYAAVIPDQPTLNQLLRSNEAKQHYSKYDREMPSRVGTFFVSTRNMRPIHLINFDAGT